MWYKIETKLIVLFENIYSSNFSLLGRKIKHMQITDSQLLEACSTLS